MSHTPGPWICQPSAGHHDYLVYSELTGNDIAIVRNFDEANARLIAAAPDLLEACQGLLELVRECQPFVSGESDNAHKDRMRRADAIAAINKALGK